MWFTRFSCPRGTAADVPVIHLVGVASSRARSSAVRPGYRPPLSGCRPRLMIGAGPAFLFVHPVGRGLFRPGLEGSAYLVNLFGRSSWPCCARRIRLQPFRSSPWAGRAGPAGGHRLILSSSVCAPSPADLVCAPAGVTGSSRPSCPGAPAVLEVSRTSAVLLVLPRLVVIVSSAEGRVVQPARSSRPPRFDPALPVQELLDSPPHRRPHRRHLRDGLPGGPRGPAFVRARCSRCPTPPTAEAHRGPAASTSCRRSKMAQ